MKACMLGVMLVAAAFPAAACEVGQPFPFTSETACSKEIKEFMERVGACEHFLGEDAYDEERAAFLDNMINKELRCIDLYDEKKALYQKYAEDKAVTAMIDAYLDKHGLWHRVEVQEDEEHGLEHE